MVDEQTAVRLQPGCRHLKITSPGRAPGATTAPFKAVNGRDFVFSKTDCKELLREKYLETSEKPRFRRGLRGRLLWTCVFDLDEWDREWVGAVPDEVLKPMRDSIEVKSYVGGLVKSFERKAG